MFTDKQTIKWQKGSANIAVVMISLNEGHNMFEVLNNLKGWAHEVFLVDSYSSDDTIDIALQFGVHIVQRKFHGYGDQWKFALKELPIKAQWTMKLDPDERLNEKIKKEIEDITRISNKNGFIVNIRLKFMGKSLPIKLKLLRIWKTGKASMSDVLVNEHIQIDGEIGTLTHNIDHLDSPDLDHWFEKQNRYTTAEAIIAYQKNNLADLPKLFGSKFQRRMWIKKNFHRIPLRFLLIFVYHWLWQGAYRAGRIGYIWARLRSDVMRFVDYKRQEMFITGRIPIARKYGPGLPDMRVEQCK